MLMSVVAARMWCMDEGPVLRRIGDPMVGLAPAGVRIRTRIHPTAAEAEALAAVGELLGTVYRGELALRVRLGRLDRMAHAAWRAQRKQAVTAVSSSRWAGAITRAVEDQYQLGMRGLGAQVADLYAAVQVLEQRCALRPGERAPLADTETHRRSRRRRRGYRSPAERFTKTRRLAVLRRRLAVAEEALAAARPSITVGGKRLWRNRNHLDATDMTEQQWRERWDALRMFFTADGESGKAGGNETIRVDEAGRLRIKVPAALADELGTHLVIAAPVQFSHRADEWWARVAARQAVRYDITYDPDRGRWYLDASWKTSPAPMLELDDLRGGPVWAWTSMPIMWPHVCLMHPATRSVNPCPLRSIPRGCGHHGATGGYALPSPNCLITLSSRTARRSWWKTSTSPTRGPPDAKPWAADNAGNGCAAPSLVSPPPSSAPG